MLRYLESELWCTLSEVEGEIVLVWFSMSNLLL
jgi:hypothetical protein